MKLTCHGGVKVVTGANYLLEEGDWRILIDCGLHQGGSYCESHNWQPFPYDVQTIKAVFVTHAHIDHIGRLPSLVRAGFAGKIFSTPPARDAAELLLLDSEHILAREAERLKKPNLYTSDDILQTMKRWQGVEYHQTVVVGPFTAQFYNAGHVLGSSFIVIETGGKTIAFSGDLGNSPSPLLGDKEKLPAVDYCLVESAYGGRVHENLQHRKEILEDLIEDTGRRGGTLMIPAFAMERTQEMIFEIHQLVEQKRVPAMPVFIDSPLAIKLTEIYKKYRDYLIADANMSFNFPELKMTLTTEESKAINSVPSPKVVIAGSGMSHAGRILHHERRYLPDPRSALLIIGYQAAGSLGRKILDGEKVVKILGEEVPVNCRVKAIGGYSAHADQPQILDWLKPQREVLKKVFVTQGEEDQSFLLVRALKDNLAIEAQVPEEAEPYLLN
jgi:metallo-beta-lactamase family protein